jgi:hypothetical protein
MSRHQARPRRRSLLARADAVVLPALVRALWPVAFALKELSATEEAKIAALVKKAAS